MTTGTMFEGRTVLVTGASSGVGRHLATMLAAEGAAVACCARRMDSLENLVNEIGSAGGQAAAIACDVADHQSIIDAFDGVEACLGPVDSVICNAGLSNPGSSLKLGVQDIDQVINVNLRGAFLTAREGARRMIARNIDEQIRRVVFISSILGTKPSAGAAIYNATKAGVNIMSRSLALEWAKRRITVNSICPGYMPTEIIDEWFESPGGQAEIARWPRQQFMPVAALDPAVRFLLSAAAYSTTGSEIIVDEAQSLG